MNLNSLQYYLSYLRPWLTILIIAWFLGSIGLSWIVNSVIFIIAIIAIAPVVAFIVLRWWLQRNLISGQCPVCSYEFMGLDNTNVQCPNCGEQIAVSDGKFNRMAPEGTIDVAAVEVPTQKLQEGDSYSK